MTSLSEAYGGRGRDADLRRLYFGVALFAAGALFVVAGIVVATTDLLLGGGTTLADVRKMGGVLAGLGVPAVFLGIFTVLPANRRTRAAAVIGAAVAVLGVALFWHAYPCQWSGSNCGAGLANLTLPTVLVYFLGTITTFWCLFVGVANFKTRNDPGGTVTMEVTRQGETRVVEVERSQLEGMGGVGLFGSEPDGDVQTQTNAATVSDGGASASDISSPFDDAAGDDPGRADAPAGPTATDDAEVVDDGDATAAGDRYCGNCAEFQYVRTDGVIRPYCGHHDELMDDMDACPQWSARD
jgi:hypothetical protein